MAVSSQDIVNFLLANPGMSDAAISAAMDMYGVSPSQMAQAVGLPVQEVQQRYEAVKAPEPVYTPPVYTPEPVYTPPVYQPEPVVYTPEPVYTQPQPIQEATTMAVTNQQIIDYLLANPNLSDAQIVSDMEKFKISPAQMASAVNIPEGQIAARVGATLPPNQAVLLGDTYVQAVNPIQGSGENEQVGALENVITYKASENKVGGNIQYYSPTGEYQQTTKQQEVNATKDFLKFAAGAGALFGGGALLNSLTGGAGALGTEGLTLSELGLNANNLATATNVADVVAATEGGLLTGTPTGLSLAELSGTAGDTLLTNTGANTALTNLGTKTAAELAQLDLATGGIGGSTGATNLLNAGAGGTVPTVTSLTGGSGAFTGAAAGITAESVAQKLAADKVLTDAALAKKILDTGNTITSGLKTVGGLLQTEEDKAAAQLAAQNVTAATQAGVAGSQFRPVGMTTRFGTSNYTYDPVTGQMTSAGYQLTPEAKSQQDRLANLARRGLTQAEQAQQQFAPLQTGAQNLFGLGNQYISQSPQDVAQNYINQQMQLLQPSREMELANLQNRLYQQGRTGVSVAQGGTMGATTPELQALYNARAQQELQLAAGAQQAGQQNVLFGAGLLGQGATAMGNYYGGQQAAYLPYTNALGQVQNLETQAQQPLAMGANLAQQASTAGYRAGSLGVQGAQAAGALSTGKAATTNPYASLFSGFDPAFAQGIAKQIWGG
jgi:hypothetical protein